MTMEKKKLKTMDLILIIVGVFLITFTITMIVLYIITGSEPGTLITCVFATCGGECGIMGWIRTSKERHRDRQYELEDRQYYEEKEKNNE